MTQQTKSARRAAGAPIDQRALLKRAMARDYLSVGEDTFAKYESAGDIKGIPILSGKEKRYRRRDLDALIEALADGQTNWQSKLNQQGR